MLPAIRRRPMEEDELEEEETQEVEAEAENIDTGMAPRSILKKPSKSPKQLPTKPTPTFQEPPAKPKHTFQEPLAKPKPTYQEPPPKPKPIMKDPELDLPAQDQHDPETRDPETPPQKRGKTESEPYVGLNLPDLPEHSRFAFPF
eukprot:15437926-Alexandrium_andersonii.AAC.1